MLQKDNLSDSNQTLQSLDKADMKWPIWEYLYSLLSVFQNDLIITHLEISIQHLYLMREHTYLIQTITQGDVQAVPK